jgi:hypothetical protein
VIPSVIWVVATWIAGQEKGCFGSPFPLTEQAFAREEARVLLQ